MKNNYGLPKYIERDFKMVNKGEAKKSMIREPDRDLKTIFEDSEILDRL